MREMCIVGCGQDRLSGVVYVYAYIFFFQAEDGIRDLVRSRGLGDVYKRQGQTGFAAQDDLIAQADRYEPLRLHIAAQEIGVGPVSYTHLTLPTSDLV